jgi:hypothetical protein
MVHGFKRAMTAVPLIAPLVLAACVSQSAYDALQQQNQQLQSQNQQLQAQNQQLQQQVASGQAHVSRPQNAIAYTVNSDLLFPPGSWQMSARGKDIIAKLAQKLAPTQTAKLEIKGYTDNAPIWARAQAPRDRLQPGTLAKTRRRRHAIPDFARREPAAGLGRGARGQRSGRLEPYGDGTGAESPGRNFACPIRLNRSASVRPERHLQVPTGERARPRDNRVAVVTTRKARVNSAPVIRDMGVGSAAVFYHSGKLPAAAEVEHLEGIMVQLILLRHGESIWNRDDRFNGWTDVDLSDKGIGEAHQAAALLKTHEIVPDWCCTSYLKRAIRTLWIVLDDLDRMWQPTHTRWRLNERHYGALQG